MKQRGRSPVMTTPQSTPNTLGLTSLPPSAKTHREAIPLSGSSTSSGGRGSIGGRSGSADENALSVPSSSSQTTKVPSESGSETAHEHSPMHFVRKQSNGDDSLHRTPMAHSDNSGLGNSLFYDDPDHDHPVSQTPDPVVTQKAIEQVMNKIERTKDLIREQQTSRDKNVNEYLKLSSNADGLQQGRIKKVFEKKNQESAQSIQHLQKKLDDYQRKMIDLQEGGIKAKQGHKLGQGFRSVRGNIRDGISGMSNTVMAKPKEFAHLLRHKFGSADNLSSLSKECDSDSRVKKETRVHHGSASLPRENSGGVYSGETNSRDGSHSRRKCISDDGRRSERSESIATTASEDRPLPLDEDPVAISPQRHMTANHQISSDTSADWKTVMQELTLHKEEVDHLREEIDEMRQFFKQEIERLNYQLQEKDRFERLEEQMNDMTELHQHEIENIKSGVNDMEDKVQYQSEERHLDIKEHLQSLETKVTSLEHQQNQQQYLNIEGLDNTDARAIMMKLLTAVITVIHILLFIMGTSMSLAKPFLRTTSRMFTTCLVVVLSIYAYYQQESLTELYHKYRVTSLN
ncbi:hypothetical protein TCAL_08692 [Tigriopus californicus]|uniref:Transmembrane and coiled-coil domains protein 1 n=1 Tax=Tigriopus californicus TaxID=6832 RepID=A0A553NDT3_TIGCA|nr:transmembrane and coiled-coil domains protein 2-like [Tigriopus californicus]TRY63568.1 hypothetical protein TCAL_08692 [Tigriopus californicus]|eukprot:TCALIF_08692-PA protein Name:"Similar to TMCC1 Transmembrane and coiled-coil domains protein 1 (Homo sapiens)" AED:0.34 eAED:0.34 QI:0/-1/0/1/-1/1/1/0/573